MYERNQKGVGWMVGLEGSDRVITSRSPQSWIKIYKSIQGFIDLTLFFTAHPRTHTHVELPKVNLSRPFYCVIFSARLLTDEGQKILIVANKKENTDIFFRRPLKAYKMLSQLHFIENVTIHISNYLSFTTTIQNQKPINRMKMKYCLLMSYWTLSPSFTWTLQKNILTASKYYRSGLSIRDNRFYTAV
jgi:hypothetical protein